MNGFDKLYNKEKQLLKPVDIKKTPTEFKPETRSQFMQRRTVKPVATDLN
jgi:hypothetical protein